MNYRLPLLGTDDRIPSRFLPTDYAPEATRDVAAFGARGAICFTWDDGYAGTWEAIADKADELGQRHVFGVTTNRIDTAEGVTAASVTDWYNRGHEIASHSVTHANNGGTNGAEYDNSKAALEALTAPGAVDTWIYPFGGRDPASDQELYTRYARVMDYQARFNTPLDERLGAFMLPRVEMIPDTALHYVRLAASQPVIVTFAAHNPGGNVMISGSPDANSLAQAFAVMQLAHDLGVPCLTAQQLFAAGGLLMDPSFESTADFVPRAWGAYGTQMTNPVVTPASGLSGTRAGRLAPLDTAGLAFRQLVPVTPGRSYTLSGRARLVSGTLAAGQINARLVKPNTYAGPTRTAGFDTIGTTVATSSNITSASWTRFELTYTIPLDTRMIDVQLVNIGQAGIVADFDHVHFGPTELGAFG